MQIKKSKLIMDLKQIFSYVCVLRHPVQPIPVDFSPANPRAPSIPGMEHQASGKDMKYEPHLTSESALVRVPIAVKRNHDKGNSYQRQISTGLAYTFRDSVCYNHDRNHDSIQVCMVLHELRILHLDLKASRRGWYPQTARRIVALHTVTVKHVVFQYNVREHFVSTKQHFGFYFMESISI